MLSGITYSTRAKIEYANIAMPVKEEISPFVDSKLTSNFEGRVLPCHWYFYQIFPSGWMIFLPSFYLHLACKFSFPIIASHFKSTNMLNIGEIFQYRTNLFLPLRVTWRVLRHWRSRSHQTSLQSRLRLVTASCSTSSWQSSQLGCRQSSLQELSSRHRESSTVYGLII